MYLTWNRDDRSLPDRVLCCRAISISCLRPATGKYPKLFLPRNPYLILQSPTNKLQNFFGKCIALLKKKNV